ncbi:filamentous haemagglutinin family protein [Hyphomicrobium sp. NDB2Meth4]|uniref:filamentous haemagglutinin family protein n=1 Tax=Hyphomicrobium sp. NDB2Meth4 TaxID=1892846 RepID=UPI000ADD2DF6|nr:filamentous haemagglutinin family protein [Hyphomicrobium sp. NDB2Meth4]
MPGRIISLATKRARGQRFLTALGCVLGILLTASGSHAKPLGGQQVTPSAAAIAAQQAAQDAATNAARDAGNALKRATLAIQAQQASQQAARDAAKAALSAMPNAVNGLGAGGLVIGNGVVGNGGVINTELWQGANLPTQFSDGDRTKVGIEQTQGKAILTWDTFNVGGKTDLTFDQQGNRDWVALNRVTGGTAPSQILGTIKADGSVYVINQNGIVFGGASQVNVGSLIASTANIANEQFLNAGIYAPLTGTVYTPSFMGAGNGKVLVERGAQIGTHDPKSVTSGGGTVMLLGSEVENWGSINTPLGQALLAAGDDFVLRRGYGTDANQSSTTRGSEVSVGTWNGTTFTPGGLGTVSNSGEIYASEGDITLAAHAIRQDGVLIASTSVNTRGTIHLLNSVRDTTGSIVLGSGSVTSVIPDLASGATALNSQRDALIKASDDANVLRGSAAAGAFDNLSLLADRLDQSRIEIVTGGNVTFEGNSISSAQGGQIAVSAKGRIFNAEGSVLDVSGVRDVQLAMANNNILVNIQGNELRDSPQNRDNDYLKNADVWVDVRNLTYVPAGTGGYDSDRYYTPGGLLEVGGYLANTAHGIGEWSSVGGTITLSASEVIAQKGAIFDISGGSVSYAGGYIQTTNFLGRDGKLYNVNDARADMTFYGLGEGYIRSNDRWGITEVWTNPLSKGRVSTRWENGYTIGRDAGRLNLSTPTAVFEADILADVVHGEYQFNARPAGITDGYKASQTQVAKAGTLAVGQYGALGRTDAYASDVRIADVADITANLTAGAATGRAANTVWFDAGHLNEQELGGIDIATRGSIVVESDLTLADGGALDLVAPTIDIKANVTARSGSVMLTTLLDRVYLNGNSIGRSTLPLTPAVGRASITLQDGAAIDTRGLWSNGLVDPATDLSRQAFIDGGAVTLRSTGDITIGTTSTINASAGASLLTTGKLKGGNGGDITLVASHTLTAVDGSTSANTIHGDLTLRGELISYGFGKGGSLTLQTGGSVSIGGTDAALNLSSELFRSGFSAYSVNGLTSLTVADGVAIDAVMPVLTFDDGRALAAAGADAIGAAVSLWMPPVYLENPINATLTQRGGASVALLSGAGADGSGYTTTKGALTIGTGASITVDPGQSVRLASSGQVTVDGTITAPGGSITVANNFTEVGYVDPGAMSVWIGDHAVLDVAARAYVATDHAGRRYGVIPNGGSISIGSSGGDFRLVADTGDAYKTGTEASTHAYVVVRPGAVLDASGTSGELDLIIGSDTTRRVTVASDAGTIALRSWSGIHAEGTMKAFAGGAGAAGGNLIVNLESPIQSAPNGIPVPSNLKVGRFLTVSEELSNTLTAGVQPGQSNANFAPGRGSIAVAQIEAGGFDAVSLLGRTALVFDGDVSLSVGRSLSLKAGTYADLSAGTALLAAPYVRFAGQDTFTLNYTSVAQGNKATTDFDTNGKLVVRGDLIDVAGTLITRFADVNLASTGDLRFVLGNGGTAPALYTAHDLSLSAARIYPASGVSATVMAGYTQNDYSPGNGGGASPNLSLSDPAAAIRISRPATGAPVATPYSAFGALSLTASAIEQGGALFAPFGDITLTATHGASAAETEQAVVEFLSGSITSVSGAGLVMPYGGTTDGVSYLVDGASPVSIALGTGQYLKSDGTIDTSKSLQLAGITVTGTNIVGESGARLDVSGGGALTGAAFVSGRGGSVDSLLNPLSKDGLVYAIVPGVSTAPVAGGYFSAWTGAVPGIGQTVTIPDGVPGLPAGTYTLLPANYALLPGAFRVELGRTGATALAGATVLTNGSYVVSGYQGIADTAIQAALPTDVTITPSATVRTYSQYNETSYAAFQRAQAATFDARRLLLEADAKNLNLVLLALSASAINANQPALDWRGTADMASAAGGYGGILAVTGGSNGDLIITAEGSTTARSATQTTVAAADINAFGAPNVVVGGLLGLTYNVSIQPSLLKSGRVTSSIRLESGATLRGGQVVLGAQKAIRLDGGATIDTRGYGNVGLLDASTGLMLGGNVPLLVASNGDVEFYTNAIQSSTGTIDIGAGAGIYTESFVGFLSQTGVAFEGTPLLGAKTLDITAASINIGTAQSLAAAQTAGTLAQGLNLTEDLLASLLAGDPSRNIAAVRSLKLGAGNSVNFYGAVSLDLSALDSLTLTTAAIYGSGSINDRAVLKAGSLYWNVGQRTVSRDGSGEVNYGSALPGAIIANGPGAGNGSLTIEARDIVLGHGKALAGGSTVTFDRLMLGFQDATFLASSSITSSDHNTLSFWRTGASPTSTYDAKTYTGEVGHRLSLITPLLTGEAGSVLSVYSGSSIFVTAPEGSTPADTSKVGSLGATINLKSVYNGVVIDTAVALPSGRLTATGGGLNVELRKNARLDLSGRAVSFDDVTKYSWGGDIALEASTNGAVIFSQGAVLDVSAANNDAGSISVAAPDPNSGGLVVFVDGEGRTLTSVDGMFKGAATGGYKGGSFKLDTYYLDSLDPDWSSTTSFARLNRALNAGGFFGTREFDLKKGNLTIGDEVKAHTVVVSVDSGSLTVNGRIDASGATPGTIRLAASDNLTIASSAVLDVHGTELQVDSYGQPIEAKNRGHIELTARDRTLSLGAGSVLDLSTPSGAYGQVVLNARRTSETSGDIQVSATGPLSIRGANSIALNAVWQYGNYASNTAITQAMLDGFDVASQSFIRAAYNNDVAAGRLTASLQGKLAGLTGYGSAFHLRPGVEITSGGDLSTSGDIDLSKYRYGPNANRDLTSPGYGAGEPGALVIRAGGNLTIGGSISDGFGAPAEVSLGTLSSSETLQAARTLTVVTTIGSASIPMTQLTATSTLNFDAVLATSNTVKRAVAIPFEFTSAANVAQTGWTATANIYSASGALLYAAGAVVTAAVPAGSRFAAGTTLPPAGTSTGSLSLAAGTIIPAGTVIKTYLAQTTQLFLGAQILPVGTVLPNQTSLSAVTLVTGKTTPMLAPGSGSWSIRLVAGADLASADGRGLRSLRELNGGGNMVLSDQHLSPLGNVPIASVIRTGTGDLELLAGGDLTMNSLYGLYTAGTDTGTAGLPAGTYMPDHGGDLTVTAQGNVTGYSFNCTYNVCGFAQSWSPANWLVRSGSSTSNAAWSIAFDRKLTSGTVSYITGFTGVGTLGGGNVALAVGGDAGAMTRTFNSSGVTTQTYGSLQVAVGASGKVLSVTKDGSIVTGGTLVQAGGGDLIAKIGGSLNTGYNYLNGVQAADGSHSIFADLRGDITIAAGSIGAVAKIYGVKETGDPRGIDANAANLASPRGGIDLIPGDGAVTVRTAADLVIGTYADPGQMGAAASSASFSLWQPRSTAISLFSAGGNLVPVTNAGLGSSWSSKGSSSAFTMAPGIFDAVAASGSIYFGGNFALTFELAPSPNGRLNLLAGQSIYGAGLWVGNLTAVSATGTSTRILVSSAASGANDIPNPFRPSTGNSNYFFSFQDDRVSASNTNDTTPNRIVALAGDIINLALGEAPNSIVYDNADHTLNRGTGKAIRVIAGGDIVNFGAGSARTTAGLILNTDQTDISMIEAGGSIFYLNTNIAGPGALDVSAGGTIYQGDKGSIVSIGALAAGDTRPGASILMQAGVGTAGPNYAGLLPYLDPANLAVVGTPLIDQPGKVAKTYEKELQAWLEERFGFTSADDEERREYFASLASEQQSIFLRQVYFAELKAGGREYNDPDSSRYGSYLRGRYVIEALFPEKDANGNAITYAGDITMFGGSGVRTLFGGDIQMLTPGGRTVIGVEGLVPPASAGIVTQGQGNISMYSKGSILLGLSRIMTTMGGDILAWSAEGDINAGRGSKTTIVYTPPKRIYDNYGNVTLAPNVPSSGAGIASRSTIPGIPGGDIDLIAPLGTIDAGEAGIRAGANVNLVALQIINAANIQAQGNVSGVPQIQAPNIGGLTEATNTAGAAQAATKPQQQGASEQASVIIVEVIGFGGGDEEDPADGRQKRDERQGNLEYDPNSTVRVVGNGPISPQQTDALTVDERRLLAEAERRRR